MDEGRQVVERMELQRPPEKPLTVAPVHRERHEEILEAGLSILRDVLRWGQ